MAVQQYNTNSCYNYITDHVIDLLTNNARYNYYTTDHVLDVTGIPVLYTKVYCTIVYSVLYYSDCSEVHNVSIASSRM